MTFPHFHNAGTEDSLEFYLLGRISIDDCLALQRRLMFESSERLDGRIDVLFCEHPNMITVGRSGSRVDVRLSGQELKRRQLEMKWTSRGGGCVLHSPGQLAVYPIVPLRMVEWTVGEYLRRFRHALSTALAELRIPTATAPGCSALWGKSGCLALLGTAVRDWTTYHGAYLNVCPAMQSFGYVDVVRCSSPFGGEKRTMGCLVAERRRPARMATVRSALVESLVEAFGRSRYHLQTGHPLLNKTRQPVTA